MKRKLCLFFVLVFLCFVECSSLFAQEITFHNAPHLADYDSVQLLKLEGTYIIGIGSINAKEQKIFSTNLLNPNQYAQLKLDTYKKPEPFLISKIQPNGSFLIAIKYEVQTDPDTDTIDYADIYQCNDSEIKCVVKKINLSETNLLSSDKSFFYTSHNELLEYQVDGISPKTIMELPSSVIVQQVNHNGTIICGILSEEAPQLWICNLNKDPKEENACCKIPLEEGVPKHDIFILSISEDGSELFLKARIRRGQTYYFYKYSTCPGPGKDHFANTGTGATCQYVFSTSSNASLLHYNDAMSHGDHFWLGSCSWPEAITDLGNINNKLISNAVIQSTPNKAYPLIFAKKTSRRSYHTWSSATGWKTLESEIHNRFGSLSRATNHHMNHILNENNANSPPTPLFDLLNQHNLSLLDVQMSEGGNKFCIACKHSSGDIRFCYIHLDYHSIRGPLHSSGSMIQGANNTGTEYIGTAYIHEKFLNSQTSKKQKKNSKKNSNKNRLQDKQKDASSNHSSIKQAPTISQSEGTQEKNKAQYHQLGFLRTDSSADFLNLTVDVEKEEDDTTNSSSFLGKSVNNSKKRTRTESSNQPITPIAISGSGQEKIVRLEHQGTHYIYMNEDDEPVQIEVPKKFSCIDISALSSKGNVAIGSASLFDSQGIKIEHFGVSSKQKKSNKNNSRKITLSNNRGTNQAYLWKIKPKEINLKKKCKPIPLPFLDLNNFQQEQHLTCSQSSRAYSCNKNGKIITGSISIEFGAGKFANLPCIWHMKNQEPTLLTDEMKDSSTNTSNNNSKEFNKHLLNTDKKNPDQKLSPTEMNIGAIYKQLQNSPTVAGEAICCSNNGKVIAGHLRARSYVWHKNDCIHSGSVQNQSEEEEDKEKVSNAQTEFLDVNTHRSEKNQNLRYSATRLPEPTFFSYSNIKAMNRDGKIIVGETNQQAALWKAEKEKGYVHYYLSEILKQKGITVLTNQENVRSYISWVSPEGDKIIVVVMETPCPKSYLIHL